MRPAPTAGSTWSNYLLSTSRKSTKALTSSLSGEVHGAVAAFDHGRYCALLLDFFEGREVSPRLVWPKLSLPAYREDVVPVMKLVEVVSGLRTEPAFRFVDKACVNSDIRRFLGL